MRTSPPHARLYFYADSPLQDVCEFRAIRYRAGDDRVLWVLARSRCPHNRSLRRRLLCRPASMGSRLGEHWSQDTADHFLHLLHRLHHRLRALPQHGFHPCLPFPQWRVLCLRSGHQRCPHGRHMGSEHPRQGTVGLHPRPLRGPIPRPDRQWLHGRIWRVVAMGLLGHDDLRWRMSGPDHCHPSRNLQVSPEHVPFPT